MVARAGSSYIVRAYRGAAPDSDSVVGIIEMPGEGGTVAFKSVDELCSILSGEREPAPRYNPDASVADWGGATLAFEPPE